MRVSDLVAPARAYPGDRFQVTGYVQAQGLAGRTVTVEIAVVNAAKGRNPNGHEESVWKSRSASRWAAIPKPAGPLRCAGIETAGRRVIRLRVKSIAEDKDPTDNQREVDVDIVDRKNRVLLFAGGPSREYQFLRNMLRRSELAKSGEMMVDVLLQSANEGVSQDANQILDEFPRTMQELSQYDTIVAFDPDWRQLEPAQIELVEKWVGEESGGLIVIAGPVFTDAWVQQPCMAPIRKLYPVEFNRRLALLEDARLRFARSPGRWHSPAKGWKRSSCGWTTTPWPAEKLGIRSKACTAITACAGRSWGPPLCIVFRSGGGDRRSEAGVLRRTVLRIRPRVLHGQRRDVAAAR